MGGSYSKPRELASLHYPGYFASMPSMTGKVVAITGCTTGTGYVAARSITAKGAELIMLNRPSERALSAENQIREINPEAKITSIPCDLSDFASVRAATKKLKEQFPDGIDVLCNNAGIMAMPDQAGKDGYDVQMSTNHLSHFLLTKELMPLLEKAASRNGEARVVSMSSIARAGKPLDTKYFGKNGGNLGGDGNWLQNAVLSGGQWARYQQTKLATFVFSFALDEKLRAKGSKVKSVLAHPGVASTNLQVTTDKVGAIPLASLVVGLGMSGEDGTVSLLQAMSEKQVQSGDFYGPPGKGFKGMSVKLTPEASLNTAEQRKLLWTSSEEAVGDFHV